MNQIIKWKIKSRERRWQYKVAFQKMCVFVWVCVGVHTCVCVHITVVCKLYRSENLCDSCPLDVRSRSKPVSWYLQSYHFPYLPPTLMSASKSSSETTQCMMPLDKSDSEVSLLMQLSSARLDIKIVFLPVCDRFSGICKLITVLI